MKFIKTSPAENISSLPPSDQRIELVSKEMFSKLFISIRKGMEKKSRLKDEVIESGMLNKMKLVKEPDNKDDSDGNDDGGSYYDDYDYSDGDDESDHDEYGDEDNY